MEKQKEILNEIIQLKKMISKIIGTSELPEKERFSVEAIEKAAKEFQKLSIERGEWILEEDFSKYIKGSYWHAGKFIVEVFGFTNYFKFGRFIYYNKADIIALAKELKDRNVNLERYKEYRTEKEKFQKQIEATRLKIAGGDKKKPFILPEDAKDIATSPPPKPPIDLVKADLKRLREEFFAEKLDEYINIYGGNYAMSKDLYMYRRYREKGLSKRISKWKDEFNNANEVLRQLTKKKEIFIPIPDDKIIKL